MMRVVALVVGVVVLVGAVVFALAPDAAPPPVAPSTPVAPLRRTDRARVESARIDTEPPHAPSVGEPRPNARDEPTRIAVDVVGPDGRPVAGAAVRRAAYSGESVPPLTTDANGRVAAAIGPRGAPTWRHVRATAPGDLVSAWAEAWIGQSGRVVPTLDAPLVLEPGAAFDVLVVDAVTGAPLVGVPVEVRDSESRHVAAYGPPLLGETGADGRSGPFLYRRGRHVVAATAHPGYAAGEAECDVPATGEMEALRIALEPAGFVTVTVVGPDGAGVPGARVLVVRADRAYMDVEALLLADPGPAGEARGFVEGTTDESGRAVVNRLVADGAYVVVAAAPGMAPSAVSPPVALGNASPEASAYAAVRVALRAFGRIAARVVDPDGRPVTTATVRLAPRFRFGLLPEANLNDGAFVLDDLTPGDATLIAEAVGFPPTVVGVDVVAGETTDVEVRLLAPVSISGIVVDDRGLPVVGATVLAFPRDAAHAVAGARRPAAVTTDAQGAFVVTGLAPGRHALTAVADDVRAPADDAPNVFASPSDGVTVRVERLATLGLHFVVPQGVDPPATVCYSGAGGSGAWNFRDGHVTLPRVSAGDHELRVSADGFAAQTLTFHAAPGEQVDLGDVPLDPGVPIRGRVVTPAGEPVAGAMVQLDRTHSLGDPKTTTDGAGRFEIGHASRSGNRLRLEKDGFVSVRPQLPGDPSAGDVTVEFPRGAVLRITVRDAEGGAAFGRSVVVRDAAGTEVAAPSTDQRGVAEVRLVAGAYEVAPLGSERPVVRVTLIEGGPDVETSLSLSR